MLLNNEYKILYLNLKKIFLNYMKEIKFSFNINKLNNIKSKYIGKNGLLNKYFIDILKLSSENKKKICIIFNNIKKNIKKEYNKKKNIIENNINILESKENLDIYLPGRKNSLGSLHPISLIINKVIDIFIRIGFEIKFSDEIENSYNNFDFLNFSKNHPSRNYNNTFWISKNKLLRTHVSSIQASILKNNKPPFKILSYGKVYRYDNDKNHTPMFHQIEGFCIDKNMNIKYLINIIIFFIRNFFNKKILFRFRHSYFPFTEPSIEVDIINKNKKWIEILGCGIVHYNILKKININNKKYSGIAFGIGVERILMLYYGINDIRILFKNNIDFIKNFSFF